ncbi:platelet glycoprotein 4 isoform X1 [Python bivittatus]|uniref:Platelet glycoprotein 4 n=2 Tax=Python bivittatus TaxID=176946 RepID=A0A9F2QY06_PYTBI|nr:platelet glycoprotein 4 isoform X1 [Python bivittatus]XP_025023721.1 platelet glycoprotein 4 isoform X1 [Python bivittatus]XP_025023722.1 platelet glycoprotein 4 isoform X1 [Python bivittatus]XP_025023723.1 platelet glycoprotein 4 isoform X1 [Python bivittatus]XP_025023724.1 platelet glycoprotein 4 isoform X1 [Python bivittatus]XP_025023725.1 platelet glycoprotein 4 isoform X1 [Python bivittatus]XP_025023726.1 platelet glycoprotein 4 isoform X1 [Python bivittatus]
MGCNRSCGLLTVAIIGAVLAILGGILIPVGNHFVEKTIKKESVIENGTTAYKSWIVPGSPVYRQFWFFDVQNPGDVMANGSAPILLQKGPYTYKMRYKPKENITELEDGTVSYLQPNIIIFQPDMSVGSENDTITTVNLAVVAAPALFTSGLVQALMDIWMKSSKSYFLQTRTVKEILWGYEDPFLKKIPMVKVNTVVGVFYPYNETYDGPYRIYSGKDDISKKGIILTYNNSRTLTYWKSYCGMVNGTDGSSFPPFVSKDQILRFFSSDICRSVYGTFDNEQTVKDILLYRFIIPPSAFASPLTNPDNICYCTDKEISENCTISGIMDISSCKQGKPVYITLPHFLHGSKQLFQYIEGMKPNVEEHTTFLDVEPTTGFTMHFAKKLQINLLVRPNSKISALRKIKHHYIFPVLWLNETAIIGDEQAELFRSKVTSKVKLLHLIQTLLIIVGSVMFLGFLIAFFVCRGQSPK